MWWFRILIISLIFPLASCGFHPVYSKKSEESANPGMSAFFREITIGDIPNKSGQDLKNSLYDVLNPTSVPSDKKYRLEVKLKRDIIPLIIEKDRSTTRYSLVYTATLSLSETGGSKVIYSGTSRASGSYDALNSDYAVYMAEGDTGHRVIRDMADDIKNKLTSFYIKQDKKE